MAHYILLHFVKQVCAVCILRWLQTPFGTCFSFAEDSKASATRRRNESSPALPSAVGFPKAAIPSYQNICSAEVRGTIATSASVRAKSGLYSVAAFGCLRALYFMLNGGSDKHSCVHQLCDFDILTQTFFSQLKSSNHGWTNYQRY